MILLSAFEQIRNLLAHEIEIEIDLSPTAEPEITVQAELSDCVYSFRFGRYFSANDLLPL